MQLNNKFDFLQVLLAFTSTVEFALQGQQSLRVVLDTDSAHLHLECAPLLQRNPHTHLPPN